MAEAEDVIVDAARHATIFARQLWLRHRPNRAPQALALSEVGERLSVLISAVFDVRVVLRVAQVPTPPTLLARLFRPHELPRPQQALPATDGAAIWLPREILAEHGSAMRTYRCIALLQGMRVARGSAVHLMRAAELGVEDLYLLLEASAAHRALGELLPGIKPDLECLRREALSGRPALEAFSKQRRPAEVLVRQVMNEATADLRELSSAATPSASIEHACELSKRIGGEQPNTFANRHTVYKDWWIGELRSSRQRDAEAIEPTGDDPSDTAPPRSARLARRPEVRDADEDEDDQQQGAWMIQTAQPQERAEDPIGMQRPTDRDETSAAEEYADSLSELSEAKLVATAGRPKEILLSDDPPEGRAHCASKDAAQTQARFSYPEWDWRSQSYRDPGALVHVLAPQYGPFAWVEQTLRTHQTMCDAIRRRFEMLRAQRQRQRKQLEGEELDLDAYVDARADLIAGQPMPQALYQSMRCTRRELAITLLVDVSGSTDAWVAANRRIIDVEKEALLLVCIALEGLREPYSVLAFSGEGPRGVTVREIKGFKEAYGREVAQRIAALEPDRYTRAGAALRHATTALMHEKARHRLLLLLSDGKPNDQDEYEGRYGAEDMRQAVTEARLQGVFPFCLTIDREAASYLPQVFGANHYALLPKPELLPTVLLEWMKRLVAE